MYFHLLALKNKSIFSFIKNSELMIQYVVVFVVLVFYTRRVYAQMQ